MYKKWATCALTCRNQCLHNKCSFLFADKKWKFVLMELSDLRTRMNTMKSYIQYPVIFSCSNLAVSPEESLLFELRPVICSKI